MVNRGANIPPLKMMGQRVGVRVKRGFNLCPYRTPAACRNEPPDMWVVYSRVSGCMSQVGANQCMRVNVYAYYNRFYPHSYLRTRTTKTNVRTCYSSFARALDACLCIARTPLIVNMWVRRVKVACMLVRNRTREK